MDFFYFNFGGLCRILFNMTEIMFLQGREVSGADIEGICVLLAANVALGRTRLSQELCRRWNWRNARGQLKDMACRTLLKLERAELIWPPPSRRPGLKGLRNRLLLVASVVEVPIKDVHLYPLVKDFREALCDDHP